MYHLAIPGRLLRGDGCNIAVAHPTDLMQTGATLDHGFEHYKYYILCLDTEQQ
jgi:hypothetical protein